VQFVESRATAKTKLFPKMLIEEDRDDGPADASDPARPDASLAEALDGSRQ
jgi:hypothetical protein